MLQRATERGWPRAAGTWQTLEEPLLFHGGVGVGAGSGVFSPWSPWTGDPMGGALRPAQS